MRLIDADALREHFKEHERAARNYRAFESADAWGGAVHDVEDAPTIDAEPVRHGRWVDLRESYKDVPHARCSVCGNVIYGIEYAHKYCFRCGAKMDLEVQDESGCETGS